MTCIHLTLIARAGVESLGAPARSLEKLKGAAPATWGFLAQTVQLGRESAFLEMLPQTQKSRRKIKQFHNTVDSIFLSSSLYRIEEAAREERVSEDGDCKGEAARGAGGEAGVVSGEAGAV